MAQLWPFPISGSTKAHNVIKTLLNQALETLRSAWSGTDAPSTPAAYQDWADTSTKLRKRRNAANSAWVVEAPLLGNAGRLAPVVVVVNPVTEDHFLLVALAPCTATRVGLVADTTTSGSDGSNNYSFQVRNLTQSLDLLSTPVTTEGNEFAEDQVMWLEVDQNGDLAAGDVLQLQVTVTGGVTAIGKLLVAPDLYEVGV